MATYVLVVEAERVTDITVSGGRLVMLPFAAWPDALAVVEALGKRAEREPNFVQKCEV